MSSNASNVVPETKRDTSKYNYITLKLKYIKVLRKDLRINSDV